MPHNTTNLSLIFYDLQLPIKPLPICLRGFMRHFSGKKEVFLGMQSFYAWVTWDFLTNKTSKVKKETLLGPVFPGFLIIVFATAACLKQQISFLYSMYVSIMIVYLVSIWAGTLNSAYLEHIAHLKWLNRCRLLSSGSARHVCASCDTLNFSDGRRKTGHRKNNVKKFSWCSVTCWAWVLSWQEDSKGN